MTLQGLLHFKLFADATTLFLSCVRSGVALSTQTITHLFDECVAALDWKAAVRMVRGLMRSLQQWKTLLSQIDEASAAYLLNRTSALVDLCGLGNRGQEEPGPERLAKLHVSLHKRSRFLEYMAQANRVSSDKESTSLQTPADGACEEVLRSKRRLLQIESLWKEYDHVRKTTNSIESKLLYPHFPLSFRTSTALHIGASAMRRSLELRHEIGNSLRSLGSISSGRHRHDVSSLRGEGVESSDDLLHRDTDPSSSSSSSSINDEQLDTQSEDSKPQQGSPSSTAVAVAGLGWAEQQGHVLPSQTSGCDSSSLLTQGVLGSTDL